MNYSTEIAHLWERQLRDWGTVITNYGNLSSALTRSLQVGDSRVVLQYNPERITSSAANIDARSLASRPCFLCDANQPPEQESVMWKGLYKIQVNPYPIFERHLTISSLTHTPQRIAGRVGHMMQLASDLPDYVIFYNGPQCGASAPHHMHFQAGNKGAMPLCDEIMEAKDHLLCSTNKGVLVLINTLERPCYCIGVTTLDQGETFFNTVMQSLPLKPGADEPMMNVLCWHEDNMWQIVIFPRAKHRPTFYGTGKEQFVLSPASVDMGGLWAVARESDFNRLKPYHIRFMFNELCLDEDEINETNNRINNLLNIQLWHKFLK